METSRRVGNIECYAYAVGDKKKNVTFYAGNSSSSHLANDDGGIKVPMIPADDVLCGKKISFVKMDLEGGEENALIGLENTIINNSPMLAICVYHRVDDLIRIPDCIKSIVSRTDTKYRYYLRHHSSTSYETVFYAVPD